MTRSVCWPRRPEEPTEREYEIIDMIKAGKLYKEIAFELGIKETCVMAHANHIRIKKKEKFRPYEKLRTAIQRGALD